LRLLAFGHFTNVELDFGDEPALHVVYGPNEAGKSTALRAITGLLYGIPGTTSDAHLHTMPDLRIGGELSNNGTSLAVVRRKGINNTLLTGDGGGPLAETAMHAMLGGVDESTFRAMFGLDHETLRQGAEALLAGRGSVGESLFDAGLGGRGIQRVLTELREEADALYRPRGKVQAINESLRKHKEARDRRASDSVRPDAWVLQVTELERAREEREQAIAGRRALLTEQSALQRAQRVLPMLSKRRDLLARMAQLDGVPLLEPTAAALRIALQRRLEDAARDARRLGGEIADRERQLAALDVPAWLARLDADRIDEIHGRLGSHRKALLDLPKRTAELRVREDEVRRLAAAVGLPPQPAELQKAQVGVREQAAVRRLATRRATLDGALADLGRRMGQGESELAELRERLAQRPEIPDGRELRAAVDNARSVADLPARLRELEAEVARARRQVSDGVAALAPWTGDGPALRRMALPSLETVERFARELDSVAAARSEVERRRRDVQRRQTENRRDRKVHEETGAPPSEMDLDSARARRDDLWRGIKDGGRPISGDAAGALDRAIAAADAIADRLRREADRVAAAAALRATGDALDEEIRGIDDEEKQLAEREQGLKARWHQSWEGTGVAPRTPPEMRDWLARAAVVARDDERAEGIQAECARLRQRVDDQGAALIARMSAAGLDADAGGGLDDSIQRACEACEGWDAERRDRDEIQRAIEARRSEVARERHSLAEQEAHLARWRQEWQQAAAALGLVGDVAVEEALAVLDGFVSLAAKVEDLESMRARVAAITADVEAFRIDVAALGDDTQPELRGLDPAAKADRLARLHRRAMIDLDSRNRIEGEIAERRETLRALSTDRQTAEAELRALCDTARVADLESLTIAEQRSDELRAVAASITEVERELIDAGEGAGITQLEEQTEGVDVDGARGRLYELQDEIETLTDELERIGRDIGSKESGLTVLESERGAALAADDEQECLAELSERVHRYVRVKLAAEILESEVERYRQLNQGPILTAANAYFQRLTLQRYTELRAGYDARDNEVLRCVRADGAEMDVEALSDGTRDQLYLALRLATLDHFAKGREPLPLVLDDVLIHFDDDRARAALEVLGSFAETTQILFFTHHARLVELAREVVPAGRRVDHDLSALRDAGG
jgi:uncharacterized protein YhaN